MASVLYNSAKGKFVDGSLDWNTHTFKILLVTSSYSVNIDTHDFRDDITNEVSGTGYSAGGATLASCTVTVDTTNDRAVLDAADVSWATATITARAAVIYRDVGTAGTDPLVCYIDFGSDVTSTGGTFSITWHANGIITLT